MDVGVIGLGETGMYVVSHLLGKTAVNLLVYDPDGRVCQKTVQNCRTAAEVCSRCDTVILALESATDLTALCNGISEFLKPGQIFIDLTEISPALSHAVANGIRRRGGRYLDCGLFGSRGFSGPFALFVGGSGETFAAVRPLIRCFAPDCRYVGPSGRGNAMRLICRALAAQIGNSIAESADLASAFGIDRRYFLDCLRHFEQIADPLALLEGGKPAFPDAALERDTAVVAEMARRARTSAGGLYATEKRLKRKRNEGNK